MAEFRSIFEKIRDLVLQGDAHLRIWQGLAEEISRDNFLIGNTAPTFFGLTLEAHLERALLNAAKTFDSHKDSLSLGKVLNCAGQNKRVLEEENQKKLARFLPEAERQIGEVESNLSAIQTRRDKIIAHLDRKVASDPQSVIAESNVTLDELKKVYEVAWKIIQEISEIFWDQVPWLPVVDVDDYGWPLSFVRDEKKRQLRELERSN